MTKKPCLIVEDDYGYRTERTEYFWMEDFDEVFAGKSPLEVIRMIDHSYNEWNFSPVDLVFCIEHNHIMSKDAYSVLDEIEYSDEVIFVDPTLLDVAKQRVEESRIKRALREAAYSRLGYYPDSHSLTESEDSVETETTEPQIEDLN